MGGASEHDTLMRMRSIQYMGCGIHMADQRRLRDMSLEAIKYNEGRLEILNQLLLPAQSVYEHVTSVEQAWEAIRKMKVKATVSSASVHGSDLVP